MVMVVTADEAKREAFSRFVRLTEPRLLRALGLLRGHEAGRDATAEALSWAWEHWTEVQEMENPAGYLYRVGASRSRVRKIGLAAVSQTEPVPMFEPGLEPALAGLTDRQRTAVVLIHGCGWTHQEVADALDLSRSSVSTHVDRAMAVLRSKLGVIDHG